MGSNTWHPYQRQMQVGFSVMHALKNSRWSVDVGMSSAFHAGKDLPFQTTEEKELYRPFLTGSEMLTVYAGIGRRFGFAKSFLQYAGGISYSYAEFTPWLAGSSVQRRHCVGGYVRCGMQYQISPAFLLGPFASLNVYPYSRIDGIKLNPSSLSIGISFGPSLKE